MKADLHVHSHFSDGADSVEHVIKKAVENGMQQISFVDHDTVAGLGEALSFGKKYRIDVVPGIEISAYDFKRHRKVHLLGYRYNREARYIKALCRSVLSRRHAHSLQQISRLKEEGYELDEQAILKSTGPGRVIYKQHIMAHLTEAAYYSKEYRQLYKHLFKGDGIVAGDISYADVHEAVEAVAADGGLPVVAHPGQLDSYDVIPELISAGLAGIERNHPDHTAVDHRKVEQLAESYGLLMTGGTDYHGAFGPETAIGRLTSPIYFKLESQADTE